jgi:cathepsin D
VADSQTTDSIFAFKLSASGAELTIGGAESSLYSGSFTYAKVEKEVRYFVCGDSRLITDWCYRAIGKSLLVP